MITQELLQIQFLMVALQWRQNGLNGVSNHRRFECLMFRHIWKKTSKLCNTGLCEGNSSVTGDFPTKGQ